jgi:hypothetical protein
MSNAESERTFTLADFILKSQPEYCFYKSLKCLAPSKQIAMSYANKINITAFLPHNFIFNALESIVLTMTSIFGHNNTHFHNFFPLTQPETSFILVIVSKMFHKINYIDLYCIITLHDFLFGYNKLQPLLCIIASSGTGFVASPKFPNRFCVPRILFSG